MPQQSKSVFYSGSNVGEAVVYDREAPNLFDLMDKKKKEEQLKKEDEVKKAAQTQKDLEVKFKESWYPAQKEIMNLYTDFSNEYASLVKSGEQLSPDTQIMVQNKKAKLDQLADKSMQFKGAVENYEKNSGELKKLGLKTDKVMTSFLNNIKNEDGSYKSIEEWDLATLDLYENDADNWDGNVVATNFVKSLGEEIQQTADPTGTGYIRTVERKYPPYIRLKPNGDVMRDDKGNPIINVTPEIVDKVKNTKGASVIIDRMFELGKAEFGESYTYEDAVKAFLTPYTKVSEKESLTTDQLYVAKNRAAWGNTDEKQYAQNFWYQVNDMFNGVYDVEGVEEDKQGKVYQKISSPFNNQVVGKTINKEGKEEKVFASTYVTQNPNGTVSYWIKNSNENVYKPLDRKTASTFADALENKYISQVLSDPNYKLYDNDKKQLAEMPTSSKFKEKVEETKTTTANVPKVIAAQRQELSSSVQSVVDDINKLETAVWKFGEFSNTDVNNINESLKKLNTKNAVLTKGSIIIKNPTIKLTSDEKLVAINPADNTEKVLATDVKKENIAEILSGLDFSIPENVVEQAKTTEEAANPFE